MRRPLGGKTASRLLALLLVGASVPEALRAQATILTAGMELTYEANGRANPAWRVELVEEGVARGGRTGCLRVRFAPGGPRATADERVTCAEAGVLYSWDSVGGQWRQSRPLAPNSSLELRAASGQVSRYATAAEQTVRIDGHELRVIETEIVTTDSTGKVLRRLRERYAPAIGTAVWGAFEVPDGESWKVQNEFRLVGLRAPGSR